MTPYFRGVPIHSEFCFMKIISKELRRGAGSLCIGLSSPSLFPQPVREFKISDELI